MQLRTLTAVIIYLASYLPLSLILLVQDFSPSALTRPVCLDLARFRTQCELPLDHPWFSISAVIVCAVCLVGTLATISTLPTKHTILVQRITHVPSDLMNYVLPYVVSFMGLSYDDPRHFLGFIVFFSWIFLITHRTGQIILNPALAVFGWRMYEIEYAFSGSPNPLHGTVLSQVELKVGQTYAQASIQDVMIIKTG
jgi:hypothetical protein